VATARARKSVYTGTMRDYPVTTALVAINIGVFVAMVFTGSSIMNPGNEIVRWGANAVELTVGGEYWRLVTAAFVHIGIIHLAFNMWCLLSLGRLSERLFGRWPTAVIYLLTGIGGNLLSVAYSLAHEPGRVSAGASGAIFGITGAILAGVKFGNLSISSGEKRAIFSSVIFFAGFNFFLGMSGGVDNMCHLGGFLSGLIIGLPLAVPSSSKGKHTLIQIATLLITAALLVVATSQLVRTHGQMSRVGTLLVQQNYAAAIQVLEKRIASNPDDEDALLTLGKVYELNQQPDKGVVAFEKAAKLNPYNGKIQTQLGYAYWVNGQIDKAISTLEEAVKINPGNARALLMLGYAYEKKQQPEKATAAYEKALQADQGLDEARQALQALRDRSPETEKPKN
jgi:rhomboid protease GluP